MKILFNTHKAFRLLACLCFLFPLTIKAQTTPNKWKQSFSLAIAPALSKPILGSLQPDIRGGYSETQLRDSFSKSDHALQTINFSLRYGKKINGLTSLVFGLGLIQNGFTRVKDGEMFMYLIHPDIGVYPNMVSAGDMEIHYKYKSSYLTTLIAVERRLDGVRFLIDNSSLWYQLGVMPALQIRNTLKIRTVGFELPQGNNFPVKDYIAKTVDTGIVLTTTRPIMPNVFFTAALRLEYNLTDNVHLYATPRFVIPLLPSNKGVQTYWSPQIAFDLGVSIPLD